MGDYSILKHDREISIDNMRTIAILMVVAFHSIGYVPEFQGNTKEQISFFVSTITVPVFFLADGYLFAKKNIALKKINYLNYIKKSGMRLLIPWLIFVSGYSVLRYVFELIGFLPQKLVLGLPIYEVLKNSYGSVVAPQLYFLLSLFIIRLASPLTRQLLKLDRHAVLFICLSFLFIYYTIYGIIAPYLNIQNGQEPVLHAFMGLQYYLLGINLLLFKDFINTKFAFVVCTSLFCITYTIGGYFLNYADMARFVQYSYLLSFYFAFRSISLNNPLINGIGKNTMGIFLLHSPVLLKFTSLIINYFIKQPIAAFIAITSATFILSYGLTTAIGKLPYGSILFGVPYKKNQQ